MTMAAVDLTVLVVYLVGAIGFGIWMGRGQRNLKDYLLGDRNLPWWAILGSIVATETSTVTFLSVPGIAFARQGGDLRFLQLAMGLIVGRTLIAIWLLPHYFSGKLYTAYEVLHHRFGGNTQRLASAIFLLARNVGDGLRLFLTALILNQILTVSLPWCIVIIGAATITYTFLGGIKSVIWNDCFQFIVYVLGGVLALGIILSRLPGGYEQFVHFGQMHDKFRMIDTTWDLTSVYTFAAGLIGGTFLSLGTHGTDQMLVQRYLCARNRRDAGLALVTSGFVVFAQFALFLLLGVALATFYDAFPPATPFMKNDTVFATFIVNEIPRGYGIVGLILAAVFAAAMSTLSSSLNSSASSALSDWYLSGDRVQLTDSQALWTGRGLTVVFGVIQMSVAMGGIYLADVVVNNVLAVAGLTSGVLVGLFALGVLTRRVGQTAALIGLVIGLMTVFGVKFGTDLAWPWYALTGAVVTFVVGLAVAECLRFSSRA